MYRLVITELAQDVIAYSHGTLLGVLFFLTFAIT